MSDEFRDQHWESNFLKRTRKWIGFFDVLGFKKFIKNTELLKAVTEFGNALREAHREALKSSNTSISSKGSKDPVLKSLMFSDSILFYILSLI